MTVWKLLILQAEGERWRTKEKALTGAQVKTAEAAADLFTVVLNEEVKGSGGVGLTGGNREAKNKTQISLDWLRERIPRQRLTTPSFQRVWQRCVMHRPL